MGYLTIGDTAEKIGVSAQTLRNWEKDGHFMPHHKTEKGTRYYTEEQVDAYLGCVKKEDMQREVIAYCRVSSSKQKDDLNRQVEDVRTYCIARGYRFRVITDIGSGINYNKKGLDELLELIISNKVEKVVVLYKDRLLRFGFELVERLCSKFNTYIEVIDNTEKTEEQELVEDLVQIVTVFSCKLQGKRAHKTRKMIEEIIKEGD